LMKVLYSLLLLTLLLLLLFSVLFTWRPELIRVVEYQVPDENTYKAYPQTQVEAAKTAFNFVRASVNRDDLDTIKVRDGKNKWVSFKTYCEQGKTDVFMVIRNDTIIYQHFSPGHTDTTLTTLFSVAKTMVSIMLGQALEEGKIRSLNDHLIRYVPQLKSNPAFNDITLEHLLSMKSGLEFEDVSGGYVSAFLSDEGKYYYTEDIKKELAAIKLVNKPGTVWKYKSVDAFLLTWAIEQATGKRISRYFQDNVWKRIGTAYPASWGLDHVNGLANTASRFQCTAIDLAKIGRLYLHNGTYDGRQVVPRHWVSRSVSQGTETPSTAKGWQRSTQHYLWWLPQQGATGDYAAEGMRGQRLYIDPATNTIIVQFARGGAGDYPYRKVSKYLSGQPFKYPK